MGRNKMIEAPLKLWELFKIYKEDTKNNPIRVKDFKGKDADTVFYEKERPLTMEGFENYVADLPDMPQSLEHYFANTGGAYNDFLTICTRIRREIRADQIVGGMAGIYNPSITQRLNNLTDRQDLTSGEKPISGNIEIVIHKPIDED